VTPGSLLSHPAAPQKRQLDVGTVQQSNFFLKSRDTTNKIKPAAGQPAEPNEHILCPAQTLADAASIPLLLPPQILFNGYQNK
jgi:hypothetical protein